MHLHAHIGGNRRCFQPDIAAADNHQSFAAFKMRLHGVNIGHAAQVENILQVATGHIKQARAAAGGNHSMLIGQCLAIIQFDGFARRIKALNGGFQLQRYIIVAVKIFWFQKQTLAFHFAG